MRLAFRIADLVCSMLLQIEPVEEQLLNCGMYAVEVRAGSPGTCIFPAA